MTDARKALNQERYGAVAENYVQSHTHAHPASLERLIQMAQPQAHWHALDVATGGGHTALAFAPHVAQMTAYDLTHPMLEAMRSNALANGHQNLRFVQGDAERLPFENATFDLVTCRLAQHHFPHVKRFFREAGRVLKEGGLLVMQDHLSPKHERDRAYNDAFETLRDPSHGKALSIYEWRRYCREAGIYIVREETHTSRHHLVEWAERQNCPPDIIERLQIMLIQAPSAMRAYLQPEYEGTPNATFATPNIFICGYKTAEKITHKA